MKIGNSTGGNKISGVRDINQPKEINSGSSNEFSFSREFSEISEEFYILKDTQKIKENDIASNTALHKKLLRKMSYLVVCFVATANIALTLDDNIQQNVVAHGGSVNGDLRFSIQWNEKSENPDDLDAHCLEPDGYEIYFSNQNVTSPCGGVLDVDIIEPGNNVAVENIIYKSRHDMQEGTYKLFVHCFSDNGGKGGFKAQLEIRGSIYNFQYNKELANDEIVRVAEVTLKDGKFTLVKKLP